MTAAAARDEELEMLRLQIEVTRADGRERQVRIEQLEAELSAHSVALARLLRAVGD